MSQGNNDTINTGVNDKDNNNSNNNNNNNAGGAIDKDARLEIPVATLQTRAIPPNASGIMTSPVSDSSENKTRSKSKSGLGFVAKKVSNAKRRSLLLINGDLKDSMQKEGEEIRKENADSSIGGEVSSPHSNIGEDSEQSKASEAEAVVGRSERKIGTSSKSEHDLASVRKKSRRSSISSPPSTEKIVVSPLASATSRTVGAGTDVVEANDSGAYASGSSTNASGSSPNARTHRPSHLMGISDDDNENENAIPEHGRGAAIYDANDNNNNNNNNNVGDGYGRMGGSPGDPMFDLIMGLASGHGALNEVVNALAVATQDGKAALSDLRNKQQNIDQQQVTLIACFGHVSETLKTINETVTSISSDRRTNAVRAKRFSITRPSSTGAIASTNGADASYVSGGAGAYDEEEEEEEDGDDSTAGSLDEVRSSRWGREVLELKRSIEHYKALTESQAKHLAVVELDHAKTLTAIENAKNREILTLERQTLALSRDVDKLNRLYEDLDGKHRAMLRDQQAAQAMKYREAAQSVREGKLLNFGGRSSVEGSSFGSVVGRPMASVPSAEKMAEYATSNLFECFRSEKDDDKANGSASKLKRG